MRRLLAPLALLALATAGCGRGTHHPAVPNANASHGKQLIEHYGCGACHIIGGVSGANGHVGPDLKTFPDRRTVAGVLPNTTENLVRWIMHPQQIVPNSAMPDLGVKRQEARDIAAYLYTGQ